MKNLPASSRTAAAVFGLAVTLLFTRTAAAAPGGSFVAHEWGTFTSVQGADGVQLEWNPLQTTDLPKFVYDRNRPTGDFRRQPFSVFASKSAFASLQRMETPVIYLYSDRERTVNVRVDFPQGLVTEWFPQVTGFGPFATTNQAEAILSRQSFIEWNNVRVLPRATDEAVAKLIPDDKAGSHYYAARGTDANFLRMTTGTSPKTEHEHFLFYRGVGYFQAPLQVTLGGNEDYVSVHNTGKEPLLNLYVLTVRGTQGKFVHVDKLDAGEAKPVRLNPDKGLISLTELRSQLGTRLQKSLTDQGLYARESEAMVKTWEDSWFTENGVRVLYLLPEKWTDRVLPLKLDPKPTELVRVMVGRAEVITPSMEWELLKQVVRYSEDEGDSKKNAITGLRQLGLGRFSEPAARRVLGRTPSPEFSNAAYELIREAAKPAGQTPREVTRIR